MSTYTTTLRFICESAPEKKEECIETFSSYELSDYLTQKQIETINISNTWSKSKLADKIIRYYYFREIGFETWALFKHHAKIEMELLMEEYLPLIYSRCIEYDPLVNVDYEESYKANTTGKNIGEGNATSSTSSTGEGNNKFSDTPNVGLTNIETGKYLTNASFNKTTTEGNGSSTSNTSTTTTNTQEYTKHIQGNSGVSATAQKMVEQFRDNIIAIDRKIIQSLSVLFMGIY